MHVEFIGLPGAGKTSIRRVLLQSFSEKGDGRFISVEEAFYRACRRHLDRPLRLPAQLLPGPLARRYVKKLVGRSLMQSDAQNAFLAAYGEALVPFLASQTYAQMSSLDRQRVIGSFLATGAMWQLASLDDQRGNVAVFEEGLVQKSFMFVDHASAAGADEAAVHGYLGSIPVPALVIFVSASVETCLSRMRRRPDGLTDRLRHADDDAVHRFLDNAERHLHTVERWFARNAQDTLVVFDSETRGLDNIGSLVDALEAVVDRP